MAGTLVANTINTDTGLFSTQNAYSGIAKAWVTFTGSSAAVNGSFNVSSVTRSSAGRYTVNFSTAMTDANYSVQVTGTNYYGNYSNCGQIDYGTGAPTASLVYVCSTVTNTTTFTDSQYMCVTVHR
jgi:hypothetical protein